MPARSSRERASARKGCAASAGGRRACRHGRAGSPAARSRRAPRAGRKRLPTMRHSSLKKPVAGRMPLSVTKPTLLRVDSKTRRSRARAPRRAGWASSSSTRSRRPRAACSSSQRRSGARRCLPHPRAASGCLSPVRVAFTPRLGQRHAFRVDRREGPVPLWGHVGSGVAAFRERGCRRRIGRAAGRR